MGYLLSLSILPPVQYSQYPRHHEAHRRLTSAHCGPICSCALPLAHPSEDAPQRRRAGTAGARPHARSAEDTATGTTLPVPTPASTSAGAHDRAPASERAVEAAAKVDLTLSEAIGKIREQLGFAGEMSVPATLNKAEAALDLPTELGATLLQRARRVCAELE